MRALMLMVVFAGSVLSCHAQRILVPPYLQPGNASSLAKEQKVVIWQTDSVPGKFTVTYQLKGEEKLKTAKVAKVQLKFNGKTSILYRALLSGLEFDTVYNYKVSLNANELANIHFSTRTKKSRTRFAVLGDFGAGTPQQAAIAYQMFRKNPQFVLTTGDNVYQNGLESEYRKNLFPFYSAAENDIAKGADLMSSIPFYMVLGNHDVRGSDLAKHPDGLAYFYYSDLPMNAPLTALACPVTGNSDAVSAFKRNARPRFPRMANYSFDYGNVHITCLDANDYINPLDADLVEWMKQDIQNSKADWKIVAFHHPGFNSSEAHYNWQLMRLLSPVFESLKVDLVLTGHVHNYQRTMPLLFAPKKNETGDQYIVSPERRVDGTFTLDSTYDGSTDTTPNGIIYIVTGGGGGGLYDMKLSQKPELWTHAPPENWVPFTKKLVSHTHSFSLIETNGKELVFSQFDLYANLIDRIKLTK
jgi:hypothetical protein